MCHTGVAGRQDLARLINETRAVAQCAATEPLAWALAVLRAAAAVVWRAEEMKDNP